MSSEFFYSFTSFVWKRRKEFSALINLQVLFFRLLLFRVHFWWSANKISFQFYIFSRRPVTDCIATNTKETKKKWSRQKENLLEKNPFFSSESEHENCKKKTKTEQRMNGHAWNVNVVIADVIRRKKKTSKENR